MEKVSEPTVKVEPSVGRLANLPTICPGVLRIENVSLGVTTPTLSDRVVPVMSTTEPSATMLSDPLADRSRARVPDARFRLPATVRVPGDAGTARIEDALAHDVGDGAGCPPRMPLPVIETVDEVSEPLTISEPAETTVGPV